MLDIEFLRSLGIDEDRLPKAGDERNTGAEPAPTNDLPVAGESMVPPEIMGFSEEELKGFLLKNYSQEHPYTYRTPQGHTIAVYPDSGPCGRHDLEFTVDEFLCMLFFIKVLGGRPTAYKPSQGSWVSW